jgi:indole-3-glycerol phosphate synthase
MNILDTIVMKKRKEVDEAKLRLPETVLVQSAFYERNCFSIREALNNVGASGIIAEHKRKSPSKGVINDQLDLSNVVNAYQQAGASALSILTDESFFGGSNKDIVTVRSNISIPILRKDFIIDEYQVHEAKSIGADLILLIAACLTPIRVRQLARLAISIGMEVLLELHDEEEFDRVCDEVHLVGINNRSLKTFDVNIDRSLNMAAKLPSNKIKVAESGIDHPTQFKLFRDHGYKGFLIGEYFMRQPDPGVALKNFISQS